MGDTAELAKTVMTKKRSQVFFKENIRVTPSVAAPGDTNPSDPTDKKDANYCHRRRF